MEQCEIIKILEQIIAQEEERIIHFFSATNGPQKKLILFGLIRAFDSFFLFAKKTEDLMDHYNFGCNEALRLFYGQYVNEGGYPLSAFNRDSWRYFNSVIQNCGRVGFCKKVIAYTESGLANIVLEGKKITAFFKETGIKEKFDSDAYVWSRTLIIKNVSNPEMNKIKKDFNKIKRIMRSKVDVWREHFIQYGTTEEIDDYFEKLAYYYLLPEGAKEEFSPEANFGGVPYKKYCELVMIVCGIALKHYHYCLELLKKNRNINPINIITITRNKSDLIKDFSRYLDVSQEAMSQMIDCISLTSNNYLYHTTITQSYPAPFIQIADNCLLHSVIGSEVGPISFLNREIKRRFKNDYFDAVNSRERIFRQQLYDFFSEDYYLKSKQSIKIKSSKGDTDIDAAIYDTDSNVLGLFQLKWQDIYGHSMTERYSRISNLYPKITEWLDRVEAWLSENKGVDSSFGLELRAIKVLIFVICRHNANFTGCEIDKRAAWTTIWQMLKLYSQKLLPGKNKIERLYNELKKQEKIVFKVKNKKITERFKISDYEIILRLS